MTGSQESFFYLLKNAPFGIYVIDAGFRVIEISAGAKRLFWKIDPLIGRDFAEIMRLLAEEPLATIIINQFRHTLSTGEPYRSRVTPEQHELIKDIEYFDWQIERVTLPDGSFGVTCYFYDLTDRVVFEKKLRESEAIYRDLFENNPIPMWVYDLESLQFLEVNEAAIERYGYSREEFLAMTIKDIRPGEDVPPLLEWVAGSQKPISNAGVWNHRRKDGSLIKVEITSHVINSKGKAARLVMVNDVTERFRAEEALKLSEERYRLLFRDNPSPMIIYDFETLRFLDVNEATCAHYGYTREEFLTMTLNDVALPADIENIKAKVKENAGERTVYGVWRHKKKDGTVILVETASHKLQIDGENSRIVLINDVTEKSRAEEELREAEQRFRATFEQAAVGIAHVGLDGKWLLVNERLCQITGYSKEELAALTFQDITHPDDLETDLRLARKIIAGEVEIYSIEKRYIRKDRSIVWVDLTVSLLRDRRGKPKYFISVVEDISPRRAAEIELRQWADAFENCAHGIALGNPQTNRIIAVNTAFAELVGKPKSEIEDSLILSVYDPGSHDHVKNASLIADTEGSIQYEALIRRSDGTTFPAQMDLVSVRGESGEVLYRVATMQDISARKQAEDALRESEGKLRLFVEFAPVSVAMFDRQMNYLAVSQRWINDYHIKDDLIGRCHYEIFPEVSDEWKRIHQNALSGMIERSEEDRFVRADGSLRWLKWEVRPWFNAGDEIGGIIIFSEDITERKIAEENLRKSEEKLRQSQKMESVGRLAGGIAHDFNNMLTVIKGYGDLSLRLLPKENPVHNYIEEIRKAGERSSSLTHQLLAFSRTQILQPEILDINQVISETMKMLKFMIGEDIHISLQLSPEIGFVKADPGQISQVLMNLLVNARDAMPLGGRVVIRTDNVYLEADDFPEDAGEEPGKYIRMVVQDTGIGMDSQTLQNIFEPFYTTKEIGKGTGLGLSTVYGIIRQSGGHISVKSELGIGATFEVYLPQISEDHAVREEPETRRDAAAREDEVGKDPARARETVLIVEDEELVRNLTRDALEASGYEVIVAHNGAEAIELFEKEGFRVDLLMTDVVMPGINGYELFEKLSSTVPNLPKFLFTSGYLEDHRIRNPSFDIGENFIQKPFQLKELILKIQEILAPDAGKP